MEITGFSEGLDIGKRKWLGIVPESLAPETKKEGVPFREIAVGRKARLEGKMGSLVETC